MPPTYYAIFTTVGLTRLAEAQATGVPLVFEHVAVGDGNGAPITPDASMTALVHETSRVGVNYVGTLAYEPTTVRVEGLLPSDDGGYTIREAGLFNGAGELIAIASYPPIYKPVEADGVTVEEYIRILLTYTAVEAIALTLDPDVITATRIYVDDRDEALADRIEYLEGVVLAHELADGSDGAADFDGATTFSWASKSGSTYTLTRSPCTTSFRVRSGVRVRMGGFPVYCTGKITVDAGGKLDWDGDAGGDGTSGLGGAGAAGLPAGAFLGSAAGGDGGSVDHDAVVGSDIANSVGGNGGAGGNAADPGASGGTATAPAASRGNTRTMRALLEGCAIGNSAGTPTLTGLAGGAGGGGGGGNHLALDSGGGGGAGGGIVGIACKELENNGTISANGGAGGAPFGAGKGGAGGGAGRIGVICGALSGTGNITALGGAGGTGSSDGVDGDAIILIASARPDGAQIWDGNAFFSAVDSVDVTFPDGWEYENASGLDAYQIRLAAPVVTSSDGPVSVWVSAISLTGFTIQASGVFTGQVAWETKGD